MTERPISSVATVLRAPPIDPKNAGFAPDFDLIAQALGTALREPVPVVDAGLTSAPGEGWVLYWPGGDTIAALDALDPVTCADLVPRLILLMIERTAVARIVGRYKVAAIIETAGLLMWERDPESKHGWSGLVTPRAIRPAFTFPGSDYQMENGLEATLAELIARRLRA